MSEQLPEPKQVRVDGLRAFHRALTQALAEVAPKAGPANELAAAGLSLQCEQCGIQITGPEWVGVVQSEDPATLGDPRLSRLHQGYCGRKDCQSYYYRVSFAPLPGVDWAGVLGRIGQEPAPAAAATISETPPGAKTVSRRQLAIRLTIGMVVVVLLLLVRRLWTGGSIPILRPARKYTVDPSSVPPAPSGK